MKKNCNKESRSGQGVMEYIIISSLIGIFCLGIVATYGKALKNKLTIIKEQINTIDIR